MKKNKVIKISFGASIIFLITVALFINPQKIYYSYKAEEVITRPAENVVKRIEGEGEEIEIEYLGGNVYSVETENNDYLIKENKDSPSNYRYEIYYKPKSLINYSNAEPL